MKWLIVAGVGLMLLGGGLMLKGSYTSKTKHEANIFGAKVGITAKDEKPIPKLLSGTLLGVGAIVALIGAARVKSSG